jgi:hypothetical protein
MGGFARNAPGPQLLEVAVGRLWRAWARLSGKSSWAKSCSFGATMLLLAARVYLQVLITT